MPSSEDVSLFLECGCCYARSLSCLYIVPTELCSAEQHFGVALGVLAGDTCCDTAQEAKAGKRAKGTAKFGCYNLSVTHNGPHSLAGLCSSLNSALTANRKAGNDF